MQPAVCCGSAIFLGNRIEVRLNELADRFKLKKRGVLANCNSFLPTGKHSMQILVLRVT